MKMSIKVCFVSLIVLAFVVAGTAGAAFDKKHLLIYWACDEGSGTTLKDSSGRGFDGTIIGKGATWQDGKYKKGVELTGGSYGEATGAVIAGIKGQISMGCWLYMKKWSTYNGIISINDGKDDCCDYRLMVSNSQNPFLNCGHHTDLNLPAFKFELNKWYHYVLTLDGKTPLVYIDGKLVAEAADAFEPPAFPKVSFWIGLGESPGTWAVEDSIFDDVFATDNTLTLDEVKTIMAGNFTAVGSPGKLASTWAGLKSE